MTSAQDPENRKTHFAEPNVKRATLLGHDIRNAVADILGGLSLIDSALLDTASRQQLLRVRSAGEQLARLSGEVLALVTGESDLIADQGGILRLAPFLEDIRIRWSAHAREKGLEFILDCNDDLPDIIGTDRHALERILTNLIGNAMKHAVLGRVSLLVTLQAHETLCLTVRDTGPGFSDASLARLFDEQGRPPDSATPGTGLGLHIVRDLVDHIKGRLDVGNVAQGGAEVTILLPRAAWAPGLSGDSARGLPDLAGWCVLVAEDNPTNQLVVRQMLETLGADCRIAADGQAAIEALEAQHFDLALVDIEMPRLSGLDVIRAVRRRETDDTVRILPILAITAYVLSANRFEIYEAGADGILAKPIMSLESFGQAIATVLERRNLQPPPPCTANPDKPFSQIHIDRLLALAGDANGAELLARLEQDLTMVKTGMRTGLAKRDFALLRARTHVLISLAGAIGADYLQSLAERLNAAAQAKDDKILRDTGPQAEAEIDKVLERLATDYASRLGARAS